MKLNGRPIYKGAAKPINLYKGTHKVAGWREDTQTGNDLAFDGTYNDYLRLMADGKSYQPVNYYREVASDGIIPVVDHKEGHLREARIDTLAQQTPRYYRELSSAGVISFSDNDEASVRKAVISAVAQQTVTVQGKNLLDIMGKTYDVTFVYQRNSPEAKAIFVNNTVIYGVSRNAYLNGSVVLLQRNGTTGYLEYSSTTQWYGIGIKAYVMPNTVYTIKTGGTGSFFAGFFQADGTNIGDSITTTFTTPADCAFVFVTYVPPDVGGGTYSITNVQLELGSTATAFTPFVPNSPSPDYPAPILPDIPAGGSGKVYRRGKNLFSLSDVVAFRNCVNNGDGTVRSNISNSFYCWFRVQNFNKWLMQNRSNSFTFSFAGNVADVYCAIVIFGSKTDGTTYQETYSLYGVNKVSVTVSPLFSSISHIELRLNRKNAPWTDTTSVFSNFQFEPGTTATPYEPYSGSDYSLSPQAAMYGLSSAPDTIGADGKEKHGSYRRVLDGTETWYLSSVYTTACFMDVPSCKTHSPIKCNIYKESIGLQSDNTAYVSSTNDGTLARMFIKDTINCVSVASFKAFLATQYTAGTPVEILYQLSTPTLYTNAAQAVSLSTTGINNLFSDVGTLLAAYQVKVGSNITGDILSPHPDYPAAIAPAIAAGVENGVYARGKNWFDGAWELGNINTATGENVEATTTIRSPSFIPINPNTGYVLSPFVGISRVWYYDENKVFISHAGLGTFLTPENARFIRVRVLSVDTDYSLQIELGTTPTPYEPYAGSDYSFTPQADMYGLVGAKDSVDVVSGVERHPVNKRTLYGTETTLFSEYNTDYQGCFLVWTDASISNPNPSLDVKCSHFSVATGRGSASGTLPCIRTWTAITDKTQLFLCVPGITTKTGLLAFLADQYAKGTPVVIVYRRATPITYSHTPQQVSLSDGSNSLFTDLGTLNVAYQVSDGQNITGDIVSPTPTYPAEILSANGGARIEGRNLCPSTLNKRDVPYNQGTNNIIDWSSFPYETGAYIVSCFLDASKDPSGELRLQYAVYGADGVTIESTNYVSKLYSQLPGLVSKSFTAILGRRVRLYVTRSITMSDTSIITAKDIQLERGSIATPYTPYRPILTHDFPELPGIPDGAGGWVARDSEEIQLVDGVPHRIRTQRVGRKTLSEIAWTAMTAVSGFARWEKEIPDKKFTMAASLNVVCTKLKTTSYNVYGEWTISERPNYNNLCILAPSGTTTTEMLSAIGDSDIYYQLATPIITDLGPVDWPTYYKHTRLLVDGEYSPDITAVAKVTDDTL